MKKLKVLGLSLASLGLLATSGMVCSKSARPVYAEGEPESQTVIIYQEKEEDFWEKYFSAEKVAMYFSWIVYTGTIIGLVANIKRLKQSNNLTLQNVSDNVREVLKKCISEEIAKKFEEVIPSVLNSNQEMKDILSVFGKILALSQENTPESRVAILNLIQELGAVKIPAEIVEEAKETIAEQVEEKKIHKEESDKKLDEIIEKYDGTSI